MNLDDISSGSLCVIDTNVFCTLSKARPRRRKGC